MKLERGKVLSQNETEISWWYRNTNWSHGHKHVSYKSIHGKYEMIIKL